MFKILETREKQLRQVKRGTPFQEIPNSTFEKGYLRLWLINVKAQ